jgi:hypothetical protein
MIAKWLSLGAVLGTLFACVTAWLANVNFDRHFAVSMVFICLTLLFCIPGVLWLERRKSVGNNRMVQPHICRHCGYDCRASPHRCPECGAPRRL